MRQLQEFELYDDCVNEINWIKSIDYIINEDLVVETINKAMVNYNYDLGFSIDRFELANRINGRNGFYARYKNNIEHTVTVELPYNDDIKEKMGMRKKSKKACHTWLIYRSGCVTQTGPNEELMEEAYNLFNKTINEIKDYIIKPRTKKFKIKYVPKDGNVPILPKREHVIVRDLLIENDKVLALTPIPLYYMHLPEVMRTKTGHTLNIVKSVGDIIPITPTSSTSSSVSSSPTERHVTPTSTNCSPTERHVTPTSSNCSPTEHPLCKKSKTISLNIRNSLIQNNITISKV